MKKLSQTDKNKWPHHLKKNCMFFFSFKW